MNFKKIYCCIGEDWSGDELLKTDVKDNNEEKNKNQPIKEIKQ